MARIECFDKRVGITYVYDSESYYDAEHHQSRSHRKLIGKIDPETGEMIPTGPKGRPSKKQPAANTGEAGEADPRDYADYKKMYENAVSGLERKDEKIDALERALRESKAEASRLRGTVSKIRELCGRVAAKAED